MLLSPLFPVLCLLNLGGGHADLHPSNANLYFEIPDIKAAISAYESAPFAQLFRDEHVRSFLGGLMDRDPEEVSLGELIDLGMSELRDDLPFVGVQVLELLPKVERVSFSISGIELDGLTREIQAAQGEWSPELLRRSQGVRARVVMDFDSLEAGQEAAELIQAQVEKLEPTTRSEVKAESTLEFGDQPLTWNFYGFTEEETTFALWTGFHGTRLVLGSGLNLNQTDLLPTTEPLSSSDSYRDSTGRIRGEGGVTVLESYVHLTGLRELPRLLDLAGNLPANIKSAATLVQETLLPGGTVRSRSQTRLVASRFVSETFRHESKSEDKLHFHGAKAVTRESFDLAPTDAVGVWATNLDKAGIHEFVLQSLADLSGSRPEDVLLTLEADYGFRPDRDLIAPLGGQLVFYTMPFTGIGMPKLYVAVELEDHEAFARGMEGLGNYLSAVGEGAVDFRSKPYRKFPFMSLTPGEGLEQMTSEMDSQGMANWAPALISVALAVGVLPDRAIFSLSNMYTKREMKRLQKDGDADRYVVLPEGADFPADALSYGRTDWGTILGGIYDSIRGFLPLIEQGIGEELPFEIEDMPPSSVFSKYFQPTVSWDRRVEGGVYELRESSFGPEIPALFGALIAAAIGASSETVVADIESTPDEVHEGAGPEETTIETLRELKIAIVVYKSEVGTYPAALSNLLDETQNFPDGFLADGALPVDAWGRAFEYAPPEGDAAYRLWSRGPDGVDARGAGDDVDLVRGGG